MTSVDVDKILAACDDRWTSKLSDAIDWETLRALALELRKTRAERDKYARLHDEAEGQIACSNELRARIRQLPSAR